VNENWGKREKKQKKMMMLSGGWWAMSGAGEAFFLLSKEPFCLACGRT